MSIQQICEQIYSLRDTTTQELEQIQQALEVAKSRSGNDIMRQMLGQLAAGPVRVEIRWSKTTTRQGIIRDLKDIKQTNVNMWVDCPEAGWKLYRIPKTNILQILGSVSTDELGRLLATA